MVLDKRKILNGRALGIDTFLKIGAAKVGRRVGGNNYESIKKCKKVLKN